MTFPVFQRAHFMDFGENLSVSFRLVVFWLVWVFSVGFFVVCLGLFWVFLFCCCISLLQWLYHRSIYGSMCVKLFSKMLHIAKERTPRPGREGGIHPCCRKREFL